MSHVLVERPEEGIALVRLHRPEVRNALGLELRQELSVAFRELGADAAVRCIVLTGGPEFFAAGADLRALVDATPVDLLLRDTQWLWQSLAECPAPVIAAVNGFALGGGCELAMHADMIVAGESASFGQPEIRVGIMPGAGGTQRLTRAVGKFKAMKLLLTGEPMTAREAEAMGLVTEVVPDAEVLERALTLARKVANMPPLAVRQIKEVVLAGQDVSLAEALLLERKAFQLLFATRDQKEGMRAFLDKRKPAFEGR